MIFATFAGRPGENHIKHIDSEVAQCPYVRGTRNFPKVSGIIRRARLFRMGRLRMPKHAGWSGSARRRGCIVYPAKILLAPPPSACARVLGAAIISKTLTHFSPRAELRGTVCLCTFALIYGPHKYPPGIPFTSNPAATTLQEI